MNALLTPPVFSVKLSFTNVYLLPCTEGFRLIDTSYPHCNKQFEKELARLEIALSSIKYLLLTHHHDDHAGFAKWLIDQTGCRVIVHKNAVEHLRQGVSDPNDYPVNWRVKILVGGIFARLHPFVFPAFSLNERDLLMAGDDDQLLPALGIPGRILYTPGHSFDSISVLLADGRAFVGDVAMNFLKFTGIRHRPIYLQEEIGVVYESWRKLIRCGAKVIYPAHGKPFLAREPEWPFAHAPLRTNRSKRSEGEDSQCYSVKIVLEDKTLLTELAGYQEYANSVRHRYCRGCGDE